MPIENSQRKQPEFYCSLDYESCVFFFFFILSLGCFCLRYHILTLRCCTYSCRVGLLSCSLVVKKCGGGCFIGLEIIARRVKAIHFVSGEG